MKTYIIYLAAGNSRRFGCDKLKYCLHGKALFTYGLNELVKLTESRNDCELIVISQSPLLTCNQPKIVNLTCQLSKLGISYSIKAGLQAIPENKDLYNIMFVVADQPYLKSSTIAKMIDTFNASSYSIASLAYQGQPGNPTIFKNRYVLELMALKADQGGRKIINKHHNECLYIEVDDPLELQDIDQKEDIIDKLFK